MMTASIILFESKARSKGVVLKFPESTVEIRREIYRITFPVNRRDHAGEVPAHAQHPLAEPKRILVLADTAMNKSSFIRVWVDGVDLAAPYVRLFWGEIDSLYEPVRLDSLDDFVSKHREQLDLILSIPGVLDHSGLVLLRASDLLKNSPSLSPAEALRLQVEESARIRLSCERIDLQVRKATGNNSYREAPIIFPVCF